MRKKYLLELTYGCAAILFFLFCYGKQFLPVKAQARTNRVQAGGGAVTGSVISFEYKAVESEHTTINSAAASEQTTSNNAAASEQIKSNNEADDSKQLIKNDTAGEGATQNEEGRDQVTPEEAYDDGKEAEFEGKAYALGEEEIAKEVQHISDKMEQIKNDAFRSYDNTGYSWWFLRKKEHVPSESGEQLGIGTYNAVYRRKNAEDENKIIYLTFDCGDENGNTLTILDGLSAVGAKAMFFVTRDFIVQNPELVKRMKEEGHLVGNHTVQHLSSPNLTAEELAEELLAVESAMVQETGYKLDLYFRPPFGDYSERVLKVVQELGYRTVFWSIAYHDYDVNDQPGKQYVLDHFKTYHHNGAIPLMHNTSESNAQALLEVLEMLIFEGYHFGKLDDSDF